MTRLRTATAIALFTLVAPAAADPAPTFLSYTDARRHGPGDDIRHPPKLRLSFGAQSYNVIMDTGSTGILVSADKIPNIATLPSLGPARLTYSSSGRIMTGTWVVTPVTVSGGNGANITTKPIPVMAVTRIECMPHARRCAPEESPRGIAMMGIGFGREHDGQEQSGPDRNPLLNPASSGGPDRARRAGYIVTRAGIQVDLTGHENRDGFAMVKLQRQPDGRDWSQVPVCISVNGTQPAACGSLLMVTGVNTMYLTVPDDHAPKRIRVGKQPTTLLRGTTLQFFIPSETAPQASYRLTVGDKPNPMAPRRIAFIPRERPPFVNTSLFFLNGFDYLFDAAGGHVGLRWNGQTPAAFGGTDPPAASAGN